jgi:transcriptional regulator with XRE-family HTH domain
MIYEKKPGAPRLFGKPLDGMRKARVSAGLTIKEAAALVGKTDSHLSKIERGVVNISAPDALKLARIYGATVESFYEGAKK